MDVLRYAAFTGDPAGGNPAGVVLDATGATPESMQAVAADVGYSETAFAVHTEDRAVTIRYFSPLAEVPFCGHATIAFAVAHAQRHGPGELTLETRSGTVQVTTRTTATGVEATLVSVPPRLAAIAPADEAELLDTLGWHRDERDPTLPVRVAYAGAWHPIVAAGSRERLAHLDYDMPRLAALMAAREWTTIALVWRETPDVFHARNPFPPGGVFEDPATGAAAAALGGYLRALGLIETPARVTIHQGVDMGRPSILCVDIPAGADTGIAVSGGAVPIVL